MDLLWERCVSKFFGDKEKVMRRNTVGRFIKKPPPEPRKALTRPRVSLNLRASLMLGGKMDPLSKKLNALSERIRKAEKANEKSEQKAESDTTRNVGYDFAGTIFGSVIMGILLDSFFGTAPWCLLGMILLGFVGGSMGLWRSLQKPKDKE